MARASFLQFRLVQNFEPLLDALVQKLLSPLHSLQVPPTIRLLVFVEPCLALKRRIALVANEQHVVVVLYASICSSRCSRAETFFFASDRCARAVACAAFRCSCEANPSTLVVVAPVLKS